MRIQHNIMAMNSYRNYTNNVSALKGNLEKLSSGYKINRAGDDAAGLAISEKMRAQITGLKQAQANAKSGINLIQTAEGALQEVQDMLNRMVKLAEQSSNGTFDDGVDREQLQKEFTRLTEEIDRINQSANFNGKPLFSGEGGSAGSAGSAVDVAVAIEGGGKKGISDGTAVAQISEATFADDTDAVSVGDKINLTMELSDGTKYSFDLEAGASGALSYKGEDLTATYTAGGMTAAEQSAALAELLNGDEGFAAKFTADGSAAAFNITSNEEAFGDPSIKVISVSLNGANPTNIAGSIDTDGKGEFQKLTVAQAQVYDVASTTMKAEDSIYTVNGQKFAFAKDADSAKALGPDVNVVIGTTANADNMVALMNQKLGTNFEAASGVIDMISKGGIDGTSGGSGAGGGTTFTFQVGDTNDDYNKITVDIKSIASTAIKDISEGTDKSLSDLSIKTEANAGAALKSLKGMVNYISDIRGDLGAAQNRLDHTINNLSVMEENIQDAESTIRDTDVAEEMMAYTKNNILIQSAQAMLAQANMVPQGVLQLLG